ncbi:hypothetical protein JOB18_044883, partial [Solea senegalensis]
MPSNLLPVKPVCFRAQSVSCVRLLICWISTDKCTGGSRARIVEAALVSCCISFDHITVLKHTECLTGECARLEQKDLHMSSLCWFNENKDDVSYLQTSIR